MWGAIFAITSLSVPAHAAGKLAEKKRKSSSSSSSSSCKKYDYVIVGAGTAGAALAHKLSDNHKKSVFVITDGQNRNDDPEILASYSSPDLVSALYNIGSDPQYAESYNCKVIGPFQVFAYTEGTAWGGSSSHNYMVAVRGTPDIYNSWAAISGNPQWSYNSMLPLMKALEDYSPCGTFDPLQRGSNGPISITQNPPVLTDPLSNALATATTVGFIDDINNPNDISSTGHYNLGYTAVQAFATLGDPSCTPGVERAGIRSWSGKAFLDESTVTKDGKGVHGRKLTIASNAHANKVLFKGKKAIGVQYVVEKDGNQEVLEVYGKKIILCAGAINSPAILERSGIGDPAVLEPLGVDVLVANTNVGENLLNQYGSYIQVTVGTTDFANQAFWNLAQNPSKPAFDPVYVYPNDDTRRVQLDMLPFGPSFTQIATFVLEPQSVGNLHIVSRNPLVQPLINLNLFSDGSYLTHGTDANKLVTAANLIASGVGLGNMVAPPASVFSNPPGTDPANDGNLFATLISADWLVLADHIVATTRMGTSIANGVVDGDLNVFGVKNLKVADIGVLPVLPNGNTAYAAFLVGLRCATILGAEVPPAL